MPIRITSLTVQDIRFPTSLRGDGSDAMHTDPDYSAAYVTLHTNQPGLEGHGLTFTCGRGTEICVTAAQALAPLVVGVELEAITPAMAGFWRRLTRPSRPRPLFLPEGSPANRLSENTSDYTNRRF